MSIDVLHPELPFLASQAAVELDAVITGHGCDVSAISRLADSLRTALDSVDPSQSTRGLFADTATLTVLGQALNLADSQQHARLDDLVRRTEQIANQLSSAVSGGNGGELERVRAFCLALSRCAAAYRKSVHDVRQPHPLRR